MPFLNSGTHRVEEQVELAPFVDMSISKGIYGFDTAQGYGNEALLGDAFLQVGAKRSNLYITTKLDDLYHSYHEAKNAIEKSLQSLKMQYIDLFLIHAPNSRRMKDIANSMGKYGDDYWMELNAEAWEALEEYKKKGYIKSIGVSNFQRKHLEALIEHCSIMPSVNQIKMCVGSLPIQKDVIQFCNDRGISTCGYRIFGKRQLLDLPLLTDMAQKYNRSPAQIVINYMKGREYTMVTKMTRVEHINDNLHALDFTIDEVDMRVLETYISYENYAEIKNPDNGGAMGL